jgi:uncharacterized repeat protein (TIGR03803 family)
MTTLNCAILPLCLRASMVRPVYGATGQLKDTSQGGGHSDARDNSGARHSSRDGNLAAKELAGNLYGTTFEGGTYGFGAVYELKLQSGGHWTVRVLHSFQNDGKDGFHPEGNVVFDTAGNLYGTTTGGGSDSECNPFGCGIVYMLGYQGSGVWNEKVLHNFLYNGADGTNPEARLLMDMSGNIFGTTYGGGAYYYGAIFEIKR